MVQIKEVKTKSQLKTFVEFPNKLYKNNPYYSPTLDIDELMNFNPKKNAAYEYCETKLFLAYVDGRLAGRICGLINHSYNKKKNFKQIRFTRFDFIDDFEVSKALMDEVIKMAKENDLDQIIGPIGFCDLDKQGMLVEGFEEKNLFITTYNHAYYVTHMEQLGFKKDADWLEFQIKPPKESFERIDRISSAVQKRYNYHLVEFKKKKELKPYIPKVFDVLNEAYKDLYGVVYLTPKQIEMYVNQFIMLVQLDYVYIVENKDNEVIGVGLMVPSLADAVKKSNGKLFPIGWYRILRALKKVDVLDMYLIGVRPEYQGTGVNALIMSEAIKRVINNGITLAETGPQLEENNKIHDNFKMFDIRQHRRRRCYIKDIK